MRLKLFVAATFTLAAAPAFAHADHGFQLPDLLHIVTHADHLVIAAVAVFVMALIGGIAFKRSAKK